MSRLTKYLDKALYPGFADNDDEPTSGGDDTRAALEALEAERATLTERIR